MQWQGGAPEVSHQISFVSSAYVSMLFERLFPVWLVITVWPSPFHGCLSAVVYQLVLKYVCTLNNHGALVGNCLATHG